MAYPFHLYASSNNGDQFDKLGYVGRYNYILHIPSNTTLVTSNELLSPIAFVIVNPDLNVELFNGLVLAGDSFNNTKKFNPIETSIKSITTNGSGEAYLLYKDNIIGLMTKEETPTDYVYIITEDGKYTLTETGFRLIKE